MDQKRYNELFEDINPSLKMKLNTIRMNLHEGKASCLVGALGKLIWEKTI